MRGIKSYQLYGSTVRVVRRDQDDLGMWDADALTVSIRKGLAEDVESHTVLHEWTHSALEALGRHDLSGDERFVDGLSGLLHQFLKTSK